MARAYSLADLPCDVAAAGGIIRNKPKHNMIKETKSDRRYRLMCRLHEMGFTHDEANTLRRIEKTFHRWSEEECNGIIQRDGDNGDGQPRRYYENQNTGDIRKGEIVPDRETGALKRLTLLMESHPDYVFYHQSDPRGCSLYIVAKSDLAGGADISSLYTRGIAVCD